MESQGTGRWRLWVQGMGCRKVSLLLAVLVIAVDQLSKFWARQALEPYASVPEEGPLRISYVVNPGLVLGLDAPFAVGVLLPLAALVVALFLCWRYFPQDSRLFGVAMGLFVGGCVGNLVDRLLLGGVTDIIDVSVSDSIGRLVFNVADLSCLAAITGFDVYLIRLRLMKIPRQQSLLSYLWRSFVAVERSRSQAGQWWKPAFLRQDDKGPAVGTTSITR